MASDTFASAASAADNGLGAASSSTSLSFDFLEGLDPDGCTSISLVRDAFAAVFAAKEVLATGERASLSEETIGSGLAGADAEAA
jgi:hypothetical protein